MSVMVDLNFNREFSEHDILSEMRRHLLQEVIEYQENGKLRKGFNEAFFTYINEISFSLLNSGEDYYALFLGETIREIDFDISFPTASILKGNKILFLFNPSSFLFLEEKESVAMIKHEILHILLKHHSREKVLKNKYRKLAINLAMDISVNQYISHLPYFVERISSVNRRFDLNLTINETLEFYTEAIHKAILEHPKEVDELLLSEKANYDEVHDRWAESEDESKDEVKDKITTTLKLASKNGVPNEIEKLVLDSKPPELHWTEIIKKAMRTKPKGKRKTVTRVNRRQPERLDLRGELKSYIPDVTVAIDISGSIDDKSMRDFLIEILGLSKRFSESIRVIECDNEVRRDYRIKSIEDIMPLLKRRGGTKYTPVIEYIKKENLRNTLLIYFTDGLGESHLEVKPNHYKTIWVVKGESLSLKVPYGEVLYLHHEEVQNDPTYGLDALRALAHEWAAKV